MDKVNRASTILIVEPDRCTRDELEAILRPDYDVIEAADLNAAVESARHSKPDIILLDSDLSDLDGFEICVRLKSDSATESIPVVFLDSSDAVEHHAQAFKVGASDVIHKPLRAVEVRNRVNSQLERWLSEQQMRHQALFDSLTDLPGRTLSFDRLQQVLTQDQRNQQHTGLLFIDLDNFKQINDNLGHKAGDELLVQAAERFTQQTRRGDTVGRLGGDEFIIVLASLQHADDAKTVAENILRACEAPMRLGGVAQRVGLSIGVAVAPDDSSDAKRLIANADTAMYQAKQQGRGCIICFKETMNADVGRRIMLERQLNSAIENEELFLEYQPVLDLKDSRIVGAEALLRWRNSTLGQVSPGEFIRQAEHSGLIWPIGEFVIRSACRDFAGLVASNGEPLRLAINVSDQQLRRSSFPTLLNALLQEAGFPPEQLQIEVTENLLMNRGGVIESNLGQLREVGVRLAMDDFGTGFSSLSYLSSHRFDVLKVDGEFIDGMLGNRRHAQLVSASIALARSLELDVVAEGVESRDQLEHLRLLGCRYAQGNHIGRPQRLQAFLASSRLSPGRNDGSDSANAGG